MKTAFQSLAVTLILVISAVSGCSSLGGASKPLDTYDLAIPSASANAIRKGGVQILIAEPQALKALDSESIVVRTSASSIEFLGGAQWGDRLPKIIQARLVQAFEDSGRFGGVGRPGEGLAIDHQVITDIRAFEIRTSGSKAAVVEISAKLLNDRNGIVVGSKVFSKSVPAGSDNAAFIRALDAAFDSVANELVDWVARRA